MFVLYLDTSNRSDVVQVLQDAIEVLEEGIVREHPIRDLNGNKIGHFEITE